MDTRWLLIYFTILSLKTQVQVVVLILRLMQWNSQVDKNYTLKKLIVEIFYFKFPSNVFTCKINVGKNKKLFLFVKNHFATKSMREQIEKMLKWMLFKWTL